MNFRDSFISTEKRPKEHLLKRGISEVLWCYEDENSQVSLIREKADEIAVNCVNNLNIQLSILGIYLIFTLSCPMLWCELFLVVYNVF